jgi:hypothetical protein
MSHVMEVVLLYERRVSLAFVRSIASFILIKYEFQITHYLKFIVFQVTSLIYFARFIFVSKFKIYLVYLKYIPFYCIHIFLKLSYIFNIYSFLLYSYIS